MLIASHDRRFIERIANRWWWINNGVLQELHDPALFYNTVASNKNLKFSKSTSQSIGVANSDTQFETEDTNLQRIESLETLLNHDKSRKAKFQKPNRQAQWQAEIDRL